MKVPGSVLVAAIAAFGLLGYSAVNAAFAPAVVRRTPTTIGLVDLEKLINQLAEVEARNLTNKTKAEQAQSRIDVARAQVEKAKKDVEMVPDSDKAGRRARMLALRQAEMVLKAEFESEQLKLNLEKGDFIRELYAKIQSACAALASQQGLDLIMLDDRGVPLPDGADLTDAQINGVIQQKKVLFAADSVDVTSALATLMNNQWKAQGGR